MDTVEDAVARTQSSTCDSNASIAQDDSEKHAESETVFEKPRISGFDPERRPIHKEPALYLSMFVVLVVAAVSFGQTPLTFVSAFAVMGALVLILHAAAEQKLFKSRKEFSYFAVPFEGVFVLTIGSVVPGLALLAYSVGSIVNSLSMAINPFEELSKVALLMAVPALNFIVWSAVRKNYLARPRIIGLMNGLAFVLSASWSVIWLKTLIFGMKTNSTFGWMLLLCFSPLLLFGAACLSFDLWRKTEDRIRRITSTFALLGALLALLFLAAPLSKALSAQSLLEQAKTASGEARDAAISSLRTLVPIEDLCLTTRKVSGFTLIELLLPNNALDADSPKDREVYFRITGKPFESVRQNSLRQNIDYVRAWKVSGLSLPKSHFSGNVNVNTMTASLDWTLNFCNQSPSPQEACAELQLPEGAVVSGATLWVNGVPREAVFANSVKTRQAYEEVRNRQRDPLLISSLSHDRVLVQCFPVPQHGGQAKVRIGITMPLQLDHKMNSKLELPRLLTTNFVQPKRHSISIVASEPLATSVRGITETKQGDKFLWSGFVRLNGNIRRTIALKRGPVLRKFATPNPGSPGEYIVSELRTARRSGSTDRVFVVLDTSAGLKDALPRIRALLGSLPASMEKQVYLVPETGIARLSNESEIVSAAFNGGKDNEPTLRHVIEVAAEKPNGAVVWIHGPEPFDESHSSDEILDLLHSTTLYDLQIAKGEAKTVKRIEDLDPLHLLTCVTVDEKSVGGDAKNIFDRPDSELRIYREVVKQHPGAELIADKDISVQVTKLWAKDEVASLLSHGDTAQAEMLGVKNRIVSSATAALVLETDEEYSRWKFDPAPSASAAYGSINDTYRGLHQWVNAPVDPRFGQSNEVGALADYGYDTARDICRIFTASAFFVSLLIACFYLSGRKVRRAGAAIKCVALVLVVPSVVHFIGIFMINNFGALGGGL